MMDPHTPTKSELEAMAAEYEQRAKMAERMKLAAADGEQGRYLATEMECRAIAFALRQAAAVAEAKPVAKGCAWPSGRLFTFFDLPGEHDPCYVIMPNGAMLPVNHHATPGVDIARAKFIVAACNVALASPTAASDAYAAGEAAGIERAAKIVADNEIAHTSDGDVLQPRHDGNRHGLAYVTAIRSLKPEGAPPVERVQHVVRKSTYRVIGEAEAQVSTGRSVNEIGGVAVMRNIRDGDRLTVYQDEHDGKLWVRFPDEFRDGRFIPAPPAGKGG